MAEEFRDLLVRVAGIHRQAELEANPAAFDFGAVRVSGGKPGSSHLMFNADEVPLPVELENMLARVCDVFQERLDGADPNRPAKGDHSGAKRKALSKAALDCRGWDPTAVAFVYGMTTTGVRQLRGRHGLDPDTGLRESELLAERVDGKPTRKTKLTDGEAAYEKHLTNSGGDQ